jgi:hypothetical protein
MIKEQFKKISNAFSKVKDDIIGVKLLIAEVEKKRQTQEERIKKLEEEVSFLKKVVYVLETEKDSTNKREIIGNKSSKTFHYSDCKYAKNISPENKIIFPSIKSALDKGYKECQCIIKENKEKNKK